MKINKKLLKGLSLPLAVAGIICSGSLLIDNNVENKIISSADFSVVETLESQTPEYLKLQANNDLSYAENNLFLFQTGQSFDLKIAAKEEDIIVTQYSSDGVTKEGKNYSYKPQTGNNEIYYYFDFQSSLSLYHNLTAEDIQAGYTNENLIKNQNISLYAAKHTDAHIPASLSFTPQKFDIQFELDLIKEDISFNNNIVTLNEEGCYTLVIPVVEYYTNNNGASFTAAERTIYYTFMAFNANTYFDSATGKPKISTTENLYQTLLGSASSEYSTYYYYNFAYGKNENVNKLPEFTYNPSHYQIKVEYTDIDAQTRTTFLQYQNKSVLKLDENGNELTENEEFIKVRQNADNTATMTFYDIGSYDIHITYLYTLTNQNGTTTYNLPFEKLVNTNSVFKNKAQRLYIFGYQAVYSDYANLNPETNQPKTADLKKYDFDNGTYYNSADITSKINSLADLETLSKIDKFEIADQVKETIENNNIKPISTNQTPVKFLTNAKNQEESQIFMKTTDGWIEDTEGFKGFNANTAGTYLYIIQYKFDSYMSTSGSLQSAYYHYQIFYFTITNSSPTVDVLQVSENEDLEKEFDEVYTNGYTNKSVYILNNAENNNYDAAVKITLTAKNYKTGAYIFKDADIKNLDSYGFYYKKFPTSTDPKDAEYNSKVAEKYGLLIENTNKYSNAEFTISITSPMSSKASTRKFTIDTYGIENVRTRNVTMQSSTSYKISTYNNFNGYSTNNPFVISWDEKLSGAKTYGFIKHIPTTAINYYSSLDETNLALLLPRLLAQDTLPVSYKIDLSSIKTATWMQYNNSNNYSSTIPSNYVKSNDGFYVLEVYDQAGNSRFEIFLLDSSAPVFLEEISGDSTTRKLLSNSESITVPESDVDITIKWTKNKAIYLENMTVDAISDVVAYQYGVDVENANTLLYEKLLSFFTTSNSKIQYFTNIPAETTKLTNNPDIDKDLIPTGIDEFEGNYLIIPINERVWIKEGTSSNFSPFDTSSYKIIFEDESGNLIADGTTYKILLRDQSNTSTTGNEEIDYKNTPSGYISFNVTSDASKLMLQNYNQTTQEWENLSYASYGLTGSLYQYTDENGQKVYTQLSNNGKTEGSPEYEEYTETSLGYKFSYFTPINGKQDIRLSYIPVAENGSKLQSIVLKYYPYELKSRTYESVDDANYNYYYNKSTGKTVNTAGNYNNFYYYDITNDESKIKTVNIFTASDKTYDQNQVETFAIALGSDNFPLAGRYVIERIYVEGNTTDKYDYFKRTLTFNVDNFNLISPLDSVTNKETGATSLESAVGGEIVLSMYSGKGNSSIQVAFPSYNENGLNTGSFYTKDSFSTTDEHLASYSVEGNKLPMSLFIPKYKYTISNSRNINADDGIYYSVNKNDNLSYYGNAHYVYNTLTELYDVYVEGVVISSFGTKKEASNYIEKLTSIVEYQIYAQIEATDEKGNIKYYCTDGSEINGYLKFYPANRNFVITSTTPVEYFYEKGNYVITIYQADNAGSTSNFYTFYKFGFKIKSQSPDFDVIDSNGNNLTETGSSSNVYYTNSSELKIQWKVPENKFDAQIDENSVTIRTYPNVASIAKSEVVGSASTKYFTIDTTSLVNINNSYIEITMQYEGHNKDYYSTITKRVYFDRTAPTENLQGLMDLTESATSKAFPTNYQLMYMRKYADYEGNDFTLQSLNDLEKASYSYSIDTTDYFKYFSYNVTTDFFNRVLKQTVESANSSPKETQFIYYKAVDSLETYNQVDKDSFLAGNYYYISTTEQVKLYCGYYEIVEMDYAGNMCVYLVYLTDSSYATDPNVKTDALSYSNSKTINTAVIDNSQISNGFNIYSTSEFEIQSINYKSDPWALINVQISGQSEQRYLKSPWLSESQIYKINFTASGINFTQVSLESIFKTVDSSSYKHKLTFTDRIVGVNKVVYLSIMDASLSPEKVEDPAKSSAILNIDVPTAAQVQSTSSTYVYPTNIEIYQYNPVVAIGDNWELKIIANQAPYGTWVPESGFETALEFISFNTISGGRILQIRINLGANATQKVKYVITDNFGKTSTVIQLANEVGYREISGLTTVYTDFESDESITYTSASSINYSYNVLLYTIEVYDRYGLEITDTITPVTNNATNISVLTFDPSADNFYDDLYKILVWDIEDVAMQPLKTINIRLYNKLPFRTNNPSEVENGGIIFNDKHQRPIEEKDFGKIASKTINFYGVNYTASAEYLVATQSVTMRYKNGQDFAFEGGYSYQNLYSYSVYLSSDNGLNWTNINSPTSDTSGYTIKEAGEYIVFIKYDSETYFTNLCKIFTLNILAGDDNLYPYFITVDGIVVEKSDIKFKFKNSEYDVNYIVSVDYSSVNLENPDDSRLKIVKNDNIEDVEITRKDYDSENSVVVEIWYYECSLSRGYFSIIYIPTTNSILTTLTYETPSGSTEDNNLIGKTQVIEVADSLNEPDLDKIKINFTSSHGIAENKINVEVLKLFNGSYVEIEYTPESNGSNSFIYLDRAGTYRLKFYDSCSPANVQMFKTYNYLEFKLLNTVPFVVTEIDKDGNETTTEPIQKAIYNGTVKIKPTNITSYYPAASGYPKINVKLNGHEYKGYQQNNHVYTFTTPGYYTISFTASRPGTEIRQEQYNFTIINPNESRDTFEFAQYDNYYIQQVIKDGVDITERLIKISNFKTVPIGDKTYLSNISISHLDKKTGRGRYTVVINHNKSNLANIIGESFAFSFWINHVDNVPISISANGDKLAEGAKTSKDILVTFNVQNLYNSVGDCYIKIGDEVTKYYTSETISNYGNNDSITIVGAGTYYVQVYTTSGKLIYSYKVVKTDPLNMFAILAIVFGSIAFLAIVFITIKLRKRQRVK